MSFHGSLKALPLAEIVQLVGCTEKTGLLVVERATERKQVAFERGVAVYCSSGGAKEHLGHHLIVRTRVTEEQVEDALRLQALTGRRLGEILVDSGLLTERELRETLQRKIEDSLLDLFTWTAGRFAFREGPLGTEAAPVRFEWPWRKLVLEGSRRRAELERVRLVVPHDDATFRATGDADDELERGEAKLLSLVARGMTVRQICDAYHTSDFEVLSFLARRVQQGALEVIEASPDGGAEEPCADEIASEGEILVAAGFLSEALHAWRRGLALHPGDARMLEGLRTVAERLRRGVDSTWGGPNAPLHLAVSRDSIDVARLPPREAFVVRHAAEGATLRAVLRLAPFDELDVLATLDSLLREGVLEPAGALV